jgi:hypothetical protein
VECKGKVSCQNVGSSGAQLPLNTRNQLQGKKGIILMPRFKKLIMKLLFRLVAVYSWLISLYRAFVLHA